jgi:hypothetical protein
VLVPSLSFCSPARTDSGRRRGTDITSGGVSRLDSACSRSLLTEHGLQAALREVTARHPQAALLADGEGARRCCDSRAQNRIVVGARKGVNDRRSPSRRIRSRPRSRPRPRRGTHDSPAVEPYSPYDSCPAFASRRHLQPARSRVVRQQKRRGCNRDRHSTARTIGGTDAPGDAFEVRQRQLAMRARAKKCRCHGGGS